MRNLIISLLALLVVSCASYPNRNGLQATETPQTKVVNPYFSDPAKDYLYKADLSIYKRILSGVLIIKKTGEDRHRVAFTTKMGNKIFDFTIGERRSEVHYILEEMNKKFILNMLQTDFKALTRENHSIERTYTRNEEMVYKTVIEGDPHFYLYAQDTNLTRHGLSKIVRSKRGKEKTIFTFSEIDEGRANNIHIVHKDVPLIIVLSAI